MSKPLEESELQWIGVDFDKTLCGSSGYPDFEILGPLPGAVEAMHELHKRGWKITIFTARPWVDYRKIEEWCETHQIPTRRIICGKPLFKWMIDDRNLEFNPDKPLESWESILNRVGGDTDLSESKDDTPESSPSI